MIKYELNFECIKAGTVYGHGGGECHGLLFAMLGDMSPEFSNAVHDAKENPFSVGPLRGQGRLKSGLFYLLEGNSYSFTVSALSETMQEFVRRMTTVTRSPHQFRLGSADCRWTEPKLVRETSFDDLLRQAPQAKFGLKFRSPTCFRSQGVTLLYPGPELVFHNLQEKWNSFSPVPLSIDIDAQLFVSKYRLKTRAVRFSQYQLNGFTGIVEYCFAKHAGDDFKHAIWTLAQFASFSGIGYKTGMGMGDTEFLPKPVQL